MDQPLLIGQAPGPNTSPWAVLYPRPRTSAGGRLVSLMGLDVRTYLRLFQRINLLQEHPGRWSRDDCWPSREGRVAAMAVWPLLANRTVILVGRNVAKSFALDQLPFHRLIPGLEAARLRPEPSPWARVHPQAVACIPHPSGRNRWYNREERREEARAFWRDFLTTLLGRPRHTPL